MKRFRVMVAVVAGVLLLGASGVAAEEEAFGSREYRDHCASCHGMTARGDGPYASVLERTMPDLTLLSRKNNGVFPFERVIRIIDGREEVQAHGPREMPLWGQRYRMESLEQYAPLYGSYNVEDMVRGRILSLTFYLYTLQQ